MECTKCRNIINKDFKFCNKCGEPVLLGDSVLENSNPENKIIFKIVPVWRVVIFSFLSFGIYSMYWFAQNFSAISESRKFRGKKTNPVLWGIFNNLTSEILFKEIDLLKRKKYGKGLSIHPALLGVFYFIFVLAFSQVLLLPIIAIITILTLQNTFKRYSEFGLCEYSELKFSWREIAISVIGIILTLLSLFNIFYKNSEIWTGDGITNKDMQQIVVEANKGLPMMVDTETRFDLVTGYDNAITYKYTLINYFASDLDKTTFNNSLKPDLVKNICTSEETKLYVNNKIKFNFDYYDKNNIFFERILVNTETDCT